MIRVNCFVPKIILTYVWGCSSDRNVSAVGCWYEGNFDPSVRID